MQVCQLLFEVMRYVFQISLEFMAYLYHKLFKIVANCVTKCCAGVSNGVIPVECLGASHTQIISMLAFFQGFVFLESDDTLVFPLKNYLDKGIYILKKSFLI